MKHRYLNLVWYPKNYPERTGVFISALQTFDSQEFTSADLGPQLWATGPCSLAPFIVYGEKFVLEVHPFISS